MTQTKEVVLVQAAAQPRWREEHARVVVTAWRESGLSQAKFCRLHQVHAVRFGRWVRRLKSTATEPVPFHEVRVRRARRPEVPSEDRIEVVLASGHVIRVPHAFVTEELRRVLDLLEPV